MKDDNFATVAKLRKLDGFKLAIVGMRKLDTAQAELVIKGQWKAVLDWHANLRKTAVQLPSAIIAGDERGVGAAAQNLARELTGKAAFRFLPDWIKWGKEHAGGMRAQLLAQEADALLLIWNGKSKDCREVRTRFLAHARPVYEVEISMNE